MRILPELEAYRDRLIERAAGWPETPDDELLRDLNQCLEQMSLLEKGIAALKRQLEKAPPAKAQPAKAQPTKAQSMEAEAASTETVPPTKASHTKAPPTETVPPTKTPPTETVPAEAQRTIPGRQDSADDAKRAKPAEMGPEPDEAERVSHRLAIQQQTYELTAAYVTVLRRHIDNRSS